jgi:hypothetical protein
MSFNMLAENFHAYREELVTPHWDWYAEASENHLTVLFLTNNLAAHEPEELAQRFPGIKPLVAPVVGDSYKNTFDGKWLAATLSSNLDLIVVTARELLRDLTPEMREALTAKIKGGTPLLCLVDDPGWRTFIKAQLEPDSPPLANAKDWDAFIKAHPSVELGDQMGRLLPLEVLNFRSVGGKLHLSEYKIGNGSFFWAGGYDLAWVYPNAFVPRADALCTIDNEVALALAARMIRFAAGVKAEFQTKSLDISGNLAVFTFDHTVKIGKLRWELYSEFSCKLASGAEPLNNTDKLTLRFPTARGGKQFLRWSLEVDGKLQDFGMTELKLPASANFATAVVPEFNRQGEPVEVSWTLQGDAGEAIVRGEVFDPDGRMMGRFVVPARDGKASIAAWMPAFVTHELCLKLVSGNNVWDERRLELNIQADRVADAGRFNVTVWDEGVYNASKWRLRRLRMLGVDALTAPGSPVLCAAGLRPNPVNVCVPPNIRNKNKFDPAERSKKLVEFASKNAKYSPLGYLLCDEPNFPHWQPFRDWAAELAGKGDPGARVGFSGAWLGVGHRSGDIASCDNLIAYSPHYLYTTNLWRGVERDLLRSFVKPGSLFSCWTQYCPDKDCEPYARTMPWLLLFEGANGLSVFGALGFHALAGDLRPTHEARWWSEEVKQLHAGTGAQLISMSRDVGNVRLLFPEQVLSGGASKAAVENWARALNELGVPYKFISSIGLEGIDPKQVSLLVCPVVPVLASEDVKALRKYVDAGGTLVASAPTGILSNMVEPPQTEFWKTESFKKVEAPPEKPLANLADISGLFGFKRDFATGIELSKISAQLTLQTNIPLDIAWTNGAWGADTVEVGSGGDAVIAVTAKTLASFSVKKGVDIPDYLQSVVKSPAVLENRIGSGKAYYLNFSCGSEQLKSVVQWLGKQSGFRGCGAKIIAGGQEAQNVYLYPMSGNGLEMLGVIQDYIKTPPAKMNSDKETAIYFKHGPELWSSVPAELSLPDSRHIYDARNGLYLGFGKSAPFELQAGRPDLFALLPYKVSAVDVKIPSKVKAGDILKMAATIVADRKPVGDHVVNFQLTAPDGTELASNAQDVKFKAGAGSLSMQLPFNAQGGKWQLKVRDAVTGVQNSYTLEVESAGVASAVPELIVKQIPFPWKEGDWQDYKADNAADLEKVRINVSPLNRILMRYGADIGKMHLQFKVQLKSRTGYFNLRYDVNNDYEAMKWEDKRQISGGGLGIDRPVPYMWFTNGFLTVLYDDKPVTGFAVSSVKEIRSGSAGGFEVVWDSPHGKLTGEFMMELSSDALFIRLIAAPDIPVKKISVKMRSYAGGFGSPASTKRFSRTMRGKDYNGSKLVPGSDTEFALLGCDINDYALGKGDGPGGIHLMPGEWDSISFGLDNLLEKAVDLKPGQNASYHFALRIFPKQTNTNGFDNMRDSHKDVQETLRNIYGGSHVY